MDTNVVARYILAVADERHPLSDAKLRGWITTARVFDENSFNAVVTAVKARALGTLREPRYFLVRPIFRSSLVASAIPLFTLTRRGDPVIHYIKKSNTEVITYPVSPKEKPAGWHPTYSTFAVFKKELDRTAKLDREANKHCFMVLYGSDS